MNDDQKITYFGEANYRNLQSRFGIKKIDRRKHMYVIGKTGMGKTTLLENMAMQDIQSGEGIAFIDPHGETAYKLLDFVPKERMKDVIYFDPADSDFPIGFNVMENVDPDRRHFIASGLMGVFKKIFGPDVWSARMEYILGNTVLALLEYPNSTLLSINPMLAVKEYRKKVVDNVTDPVIKAFWTQEFAKYTERFAAEATPAIQNKVGQFTSNALIRNIIGQPKSTFDFRKAMDEKKILIINLAKGRVGEDASRLLGAMIVTKLYLAAMSRVDIEDEEHRPDFYLYVDEFQNFATESFANILSEARKYRLCLILAHQYMAQLAEEVRDAVVGNVGTMVSFRVGAEDAEFLEKEFGPDFMATDIVNLGFAQVYLKLMIDGVASHPFSSTTLPPIQVPHESFKAEIVALSRKQFGTPRQKVDDMINEWSKTISGEIGEKKSFGGAMASPGASAHANTSNPASFAPPRQDISQARLPDGQVKMYDAVCVVCNKKIQVPFLPDPNRPVFCKDHIGLAGEYKAKTRLNESVGQMPARNATGAGGPQRPTEPQRSELPQEPRFTRPEPRPAPRPMDSPAGLRPRAGEFVARLPVNQAGPRIEQRASLKDLEPARDGASQDERHQQFSRPRFEQPFKKNENLQALREALKKSMESTREEKQEEKITPEIKPQAPIQNNSSTSGTLRPGERIEL
ncbi:MAG: type IV secretion system DNA-binding domain-containing protein [bacterium]|nr:type IV secretion system DNA-binding domain-containing protein [bacterium]